MNGMYTVPLSEIIEKMKLENLTPEIDTENIGANPADWKCGVCVC